MGCGGHPDFLLRSFLFYPKRFTLFHFFFLTRGTYHSDKQQSKASVLSWREKTALLLDGRPFSQLEQGSGAAWGQQRAQEAPATHRPGDSHGPRRARSCPGFAGWATSGVSEGHSLSWPGGVAQQESPGGCLAGVDAWSGDGGS